MSIEKGSVVDLRNIRFKKASRIIGNRISFRNAEVSDAEFIVNARTDEKKSRFISSTSKDVKAQEAWLERYALDDGQVYFIIEDKKGDRVGTVRLYDALEDSFCWGSWILQDGSPSSFSIESALIIYKFALSLGFTRSHFDVRKGNTSVWSFHERFGAVRTGETDQDYLYEISQAAIESSLERYARFLPKEPRIVY